VDNPLDARGDGGAEQPLGALDRLLLPRRKRIQ
jgi:hypothetical protein